MQLWFLTGFSRAQQKIGIFSFFHPKVYSIGQIYAIGEVTNTQPDKKSQTLFYWESKSSWFLLFDLFFICNSRSREINSKRMWPQKSSVTTIYNVTTFYERLYSDGPTRSIRSFQLKK
jgi:hypothetical protein